MPSHPELKDVAGYGRFLLYLIFLLIAIAIIVQPFTNVTSIIYAFSWGLAIASPSRSYRWPTCWSRG